MSKKLAKYLPLTKKEFKEFFVPYRRAFPDWDVEHDFTLARRCGPLRQSIDFQLLRYAAYRPAHSINILIPIPDGCWLLQQWLDAKHRQVERSEHAIKWPLILKAMEEQFLPSIRLPLDVTETLRLAEKEVERDRIVNINHYTGLAVLNAYLENAERALYWCARVEQTATNLGRPLGDWETRKLHYTVQLQQAIKMGKEREFLS